MEKISQKMSMSNERTTQMVQQFYQLVEYGVRNPSQLAVITERLIPILKVLDTSSQLVKFTLEFYKNEHPVQTKALLSSLHASRALKDGSILTQSCFGSFMSQLLFQTVTDSAIECTKYCTQHWIERITIEKVEAKTMPSPFQYLNTSTPTHPSAMAYTTLLQFKLLDSKERKLIILDFRKLANLIPAIFYPRIAVAFFIFIDFYKNESKVSLENHEVCLWAETWYNMLVSSLAACSCHGDVQSTWLTWPLHHILCAMAISTDTLEFIASLPDVLANILNCLEMLRENSSGLTEKWISILLSELQSKSVNQNQ